MKQRSFAASTRSYAGRLLLLFALFLGACSSDSSPQDARAQGGRGSGGRPAQPPTPVAVRAAERGDIAATYAATATLEAESDAEILARVSGVVERIVREEGARVERGDPLLQIENDEYQLRVDQAAARTENLRSQYERLEGMVDNKLVSEEEFETAASNLADAEANEGLARLDLSYTTVRSPFEGRVIERLVDAGETVNEGTPLFRVADFDPLLARVHVPAKEFNQLEVDQPVDLVLDSDGTRLQAHIDRISPIIDPNSGTIKVTVEIESYPPGTRPGDFAEVRIVTERRLDRVLVPRIAVITDKGDEVVYVAAGDTAERRTVETGFADEQNVEILSGVEAGEPVVTKGQRSLRHGAPIRVLEGPGSDAAASEDEDSSAPQRQNS